MSILILPLNSSHNNSQSSLFTDTENLLCYYEQVALRSKNKFIVIRRSDVADKIESDNITLILFRDSLPRRLSWWQKPEELFQFVASFGARLIHMIGPDLPLHFRWLRHYIGADTYLLGHIRGERVWPNIRIWMQQFGHRTANGFIFEDDQAADLWLKRAVVLPRQDLFKIKNLHRNPQSLAQVYSKILRT